MYQAVISVAMAELLLTELELELIMLLDMPLVISLEIWLDKLLEVRVDAEFDMLLVETVELSLLIWGF